MFNAEDNVTFNFGASPFAYPVPTGFTPGLTAGIAPTSQVLLGDKTWGWLDQSTVRLGHWEVVASATLAVANHSYFCDTSVAAFTLTLPANPLNDDFVRIADGKGSFSTNNLTIGGNGQSIIGVAADYVLNSDNDSLTLVFNSLLGWRFV